MTTKNLYVDNALFQASNSGIYANTLTYTEVTPAFDGQSVSTGSVILESEISFSGQSSSIGDISVISPIGFDYQGLSVGSFETESEISFDGQGETVYDIIFVIKIIIYNSFDGASVSDGGFELIKLFNFDGQSLSSGSVNLENELFFDGQSLSIGAANLYHLLSCVGQSLSTGSFNLFHILNFTGSSVSSGLANLIKLLDFTGQSLSVGAIVSLVKLLSKVPAVQLRLAYAYKKLYQKTNDVKYKTAFDNILAELNNALAVGDKYSNAIPTAVMIFNSEGIEIAGQRFGSFTFDVDPLTWKLNGQSDKELESLNFIEESQDKYDEQFINSGLFVPYYVRSLSENSSIGTAGQWIFSDLLGDEMDFIHQYRTLYNLAKYYYFTFKISGLRNLKVQNIIDKFLNFVLNFDYDYYPSTIVNKNINAKSKEITADMKNIYANSLYFEGVSGSSQNIKHYALLGRAALYVYMVDRTSLHLSLAESIIEKLISMQQEDGSFKNTPFTNIQEQSLVLELLEEYANMVQKSYYDIINDALKMMNLDPINDDNKDSHQQKEVIGICKDSVNELFSDGAYIAIFDFNNIPDFVDPRFYHVLKYHIAWQLALTREHELTDWFEMKFMEGNGRMKQRNDLDLTELKQMPANIDWSA